MNAYPLVPKMFCHLSPSPDPAPHSSFTGQGWGQCLYPSNQGLGDLVF